MNNLLKYAHYFLLFYYISQVATLMCGWFLYHTSCSGAFLEEHLETQTHSWLACKIQPADIDKAIAEAEATGKGKYPNNSCSVIKFKQSFLLQLFFQYADSPSMSFIYS